jgi:transposase
VVVLAAVEEMDWAGFYGAYRRDGHGRAAHDPAMMVALLLYAYATGRRSSRAIERACGDGVAVRVVAANQRPAHCTIARFRQRHEAALAGLFGDVLALCADAGLVGVAVLAVDGTKLHATASQHQNLDYDRSPRKSSPRRTRSTGQRTSASASAVALSCPRSCRRSRAGAAGCALPSAAWTSAAPPRPGRLRSRRPARLREEKRRVEEEHDVHCRANEAYEASRARGVMKDGRRFGKPPTPYQPPATPPAIPEGKVNITDPDSRNVKTPRGYMQGYNA